MQYEGLGSPRPAKAGIVDDLRQLVAHCQNVSRSVPQARSETHGNGLFWHVLTGKVVILPGGSMHVIRNYSLFACKLFIRFYSLYSMVSQYSGEVPS